MTPSLARRAEWPQLNCQQTVDKATQPAAGTPSGAACGDLGLAHAKRSFTEPRTVLKRQRSLRAYLLDYQDSPGLFGSLSRVGSLPSGLPPHPERLVASVSAEQSEEDASPLQPAARTPSCSLVYPSSGPSKLSTLSILAEAPRHGGGHHTPPVHCGAPSRPSSSEARQRPQQADPRATPDSAAPQGQTAPPQRTQSVPTPDTCPPYGCKGHIGQRSQMQDSHTVVQNFAHLEVPSDLAALHHWPDTLPSPLGDSRESTPVPEGMEVDAAAGVEFKKDTFHFFAVYDGHGGASASTMCAQNLHMRVLEELGGDGDYQYSRRIPPADPKKDEEGESVELLGQRLDVACCGNSVPGLVSPQRFSGAVAEAFLKTDKEVAAIQAEAGVEDYAGSTAVVTMLSKTQIWVANCGDSRAVLLRGGKAIPLSSDQTASRDDEMKRIEQKGGEIYYLQDCARVMGVLAMSRSIGDVYLHPYVIPDPEHTVIPRHEEDELLILGTDGLWDKIGNQEACNLARQCMARAKAKGATRKAGVKCAAAVLIKTALNKGSRDNATAIVIDLRSNEAYRASA